ncbi:MAG: VanW family protein [Negativicutes bacterium]|nr:VanW family protein [Negativicutes bacterium]
MADWSVFCRRHKKKIIAAAALTVILAGAATWLLQLANTGILSGVRVGDVLLDRLSIDEAATRLQREIVPRFASPVAVFRIPGPDVTVSAERIGLAVDCRQLAEQAYAVGRGPGLLGNLRQRIGLLFSDYYIPLQYRVDRPAVDRLLAEIQSATNQTPESATLSLNADGSLRRTADQPGRRLAVDAARDRITKGLQHTLYQTIELPYETAPAEVTTADLDEIDGVVSQYGTRYDPADRSRSANVELAARQISGRLVKNGEVFSYDQAVGPRSEKNGWQKATVYVDGLPDTDYGGGVCQVSSTLYNAVLLADMEIVERSSHSHPPAYVPVGLDATVAEGLIDFKFRNNSGHNAYIIARAGGGYLTVYILGHMRDGRPRVEIIRTDYWEKPFNTVRQPDSSLPPGIEKEKVAGYNEYGVTTWRVRYANGTEVSRELLAKDVYPATDRVVLFGPQADSKPPAGKSRAQ